MNVLNAAIMAGWFEWFSGLATQHVVRITADWHDC